MTDISKHPLLTEAYQLCRVIETLGASEELTAVSILAGDLFNNIDSLVSNLEEWGPIGTAPKDGTRILIEMQHWNTKGYQYAAVHYDIDDCDCDWRTNDDNSELSHDYTPVRWSKLPEHR